MKKRTGQSDKSDKASSSDIHKNLKDFQKELKKAQKHLSIEDKILKDKLYDIIIDVFLTKIKSK